VSSVGASQGQEVMRHGESRSVPSAVNLFLRLNFDAPAPSFIYIGAVAVHVK
jgi:hypothetical protein